MDKDCGAPPTKAQLDRVKARIAKAVAEALIDAVVENVEAEKLGAEEARRQSRPDDVT